MYIWLVCCASIRRLIISFALNGSYCRSRLKNLVYMYIWLVCCASIRRLIISIALNGSYCRYCRSRLKNEVYMHVCFLDAFLDLTGVNWSSHGCPISKKYTVNQGCMSLSTYYLEYGSYLARLHRRRRRRRAYAPTSNTASHDNHEKINSWVSFCFPYVYGAPLGGPSGLRSSAINLLTFYHECRSLIGYAT